MLLYLLLQVAFVAALSPHTFAEGWNHLHYSGDSGPFTGIMLALGLTWFVFIIYADALISPFGTGFVFTASTARVGYGLSEIGFLPSSLMKLTKNGVPLRSMILNYGIGLLLFLPFPAWQKLAGFVISCFILSYIIGPLSLIALRQTQPHLKRPFVLPFAKWLALLAFYICNLLIFWTGWETVSKMMVALLVGFIFYAFYSYRIKNKLWQNQWKVSWWIVPYFVLLAITSYLGTFNGGINFIPFGIDVIVIGLLSLFIFYISLKSSKAVIPSEAGRLNKPKTT